MSDATDRAKHLLSTLDRESAVAFSSVRGVLNDCISELETCSAESKQYRELYESRAAEKGHYESLYKTQSAEEQVLREALTRCVEEIEENLEFEGQLASFREACRIGRNALGVPYGTDRNNCIECSATLYDNDDGLHFGECSQYIKPDLDADDLKPTDEKGLTP